MSEGLPRVGLVAACDDPALFNFALWPRQRELLAAVERGPRLQVWALGRRSGKTTCAALVALHACLFRPDLDRLVRRGERRHVIAVATRLEQARLFVRAARSVVESSPLLAELVESVTDDEIVFRGGAVLAALPCTARGVRGLAVSTLLLDEASHMLDTDGNQAAEPVFRALVPGTAQFADAARVIVASTPFGESGFFAELYERARAGELEDAVAAHATSAEMNPTLDPAFLARERSRDPESFRGEYLAEFVGSGGAYIESARLVEAVADRGELDRLDAVGWVLGLDLGFASDPTGVALVGRHPAQQGRLRLGLVRAWSPQRAASFEERREIEDRVLGDVVDVARHFEARVVCDQHLAPQVRDFLRQRGVAVTTLGLTAETKTLAFSELRSRIYSGGLELFDHPGLLAELRGLKSRFSAGKSSVVTPRTSRGHSDMAVALALAVWQHDRRGLRGPDSRARAGMELESDWAKANPLKRRRDRATGGGHGFPRPGSSL